MGTRSTLEVSSVDGPPTEGHTGWVTGVRMVDHGRGGGPRIGRPVGDTGTRRGGMEPMLTPVGWTRGFSTRHRVCVSDGRSVPTPGSSRTRTFPNKTDRVGRERQGGRGLGGVVNSQHPNLTHRFIQTPSPQPGTTRTLTGPLLTFDFPRFRQSLRDGGGVTLVTGSPETPSATLVGAP